MPSIFPSPQKEHTEAVYGEPGEQIQPERGPVQVELHPSLFGDPSSQVSPGVTKPFPQTIILVHVSGSVAGSIPRTQSYPSSSLQVEEHPSPGSLSLSSHSSLSGSSK